MTFWVSFPIGPSHSREFGILSLSGVVLRDQTLKSHGDKSGLQDAFGGITTHTAHCWFPPWYAKGRIKFIVAIIFTSKTV